jgi:hypothetical protein
VSDLNGPLLTARSGDTGITRWIGRSALLAQPCDTSLLLDLAQSATHHPNRYSSPHLQVRINTVQEF